MAIVSKYRKGAYVSTIVPLLMLVACIGMFYLFICSLNRDGFAYTSIWLSIVLLFLAVMFGWLAVLSFKLYSRKVIDGNELKYYLPYIPLLVFYKDIDDYNAKYYVGTYNRYGEIIDGIWLVKNGKIRYEMYGDTFRNLQDLGKSLRLPRFVIKKTVHPFTLAAYQIGMKRIKIE